MVAIKKILVVLLVVVLVVLIAYLGLLSTLDTSYIEQITKELNKYDTNLEVASILSIIKVESNFFVRAKSKKDAIGLMQIREQTANYIYENLSLREKIAVNNYLNKDSINIKNNKNNSNNNQQNLDNILNKKLTTEDIFNPQVNILLGVWYLNYLNKKFTNIEQVVAAYNAGEKVVSDWVSSNISYHNYPYKETRLYVKKFRIYNKLYQSKLLLFSTIIGKNRQSIIKNIGIYSNLLNINETGTKIDKTFNN